MIKLSLALASLSSLVGFFALSTRHTKKRRRHAEWRLYEAVKQVGGREIKIEKRQGSTIKGTWPYRIHYRDAEGKLQTYYVSYSTDGKTYWDRLLTTSKPPISSSKEQIVSDMQSQIDALQAELKRVRKANFHAIESRSN